MIKTGIVIPAHNEENRIARCLTSLQPFQQNGDPIIVIDGNSEDRTAEIAERFGNIVVLSSRLPERGWVTGQGIEYLMTYHSDCDMILIAHADMIFSEPARNRLLHALNQNHEIQWGCFGCRIQHSGIGLKIIEWGNAVRAKWFRFPYGDQVQFFRTAALKKAGFPKQPWLEDLELCYRFQHEKRFLYLNEPVWIPRRHWNQGIIKTTLRNWKRIYHYRKNRNNPEFTYNAGD